MRRWTSLAAALLAVPALAFAQEETSSANGEPLEKRFDVQMQGGIGGWTGNASDVTTNVGPSYGVLAAYNAMPWLAYELGYTGHTNGFSDNSGSRLSANRVQLDAKAGPQLVMPIPWRPYAFAGIAADFLNAGSSSFAFSSSFEGEIPLGAGADFFTNSPVRVGARGAFNFNPGVGGAAGPISDHPSSWQAGITASATF